jgi:GTP-binding protein LepA
MRKAFCKRFIESIFFKNNLYSHLQGAIKYLCCPFDSLMKHIRNFCIIAHIDHGKSTLADRLLDATGAVTEREKQDQLLDNMDLERERGITIKSHAIQMNYTLDGEDYVFNLIDTPGHVDFSYEVSRSIAACEGALLVVDAAQSIQAQTISNLYLALENDLEIIPVLNKVDLPSANPEEVTDDIVDLLGCRAEEVIHCSAKTGLGIESILEAIVARIPSPDGDNHAPLQALIFDSVYNPFRGVETYFRVMNGQIAKGDRIKFIATGKEYNADEVGALKLKQEPRKCVETGDVGYLITGIKEAKEVQVGDTITLAASPTDSPIEGFEEVKPMVFAGIYPVDTEDYEELRNSMEKLQLNDASLVFQPESSAALGFGFRCGFLGMLHLEIIQERLEREFDMSVITTVPNVSYHAYTKKNPDEIVLVNNPTDLPDPSILDHVEEPFIKASIITKADYVGNVMSLCIEKRGQITNQTYLTPERVELSFDMPLAEIVFDFYDRLKSVSRGYASFDYSPIGLRTSKLVKVDILLNASPVDALSALVHTDNAYTLGKKMCEKLKELIPRQQFDIPIQAAIGAKIISRETIKAVRKDVTAKCYGGDITRKRKLLEKQKKGKKKMRQVGNVEIPQQAFMAVLQLND